jgi:quinol monooxygenase YgiN
MIHVIAVITAQAGKRSELLEAFSQIVPLVHEEKGCVAYEPVTDADDAGDMQTKLGADTFMVVEKWRTMDDLKAHSASEHMVQYAKTAGHLVADRKIHVLS